ncbi:MAG: hypothetical protein DMF61_04460 [Blastocatellia bacterium AA13]|nr:MAG: hypothetical protein DMF61_04460 [Blastocatellia bacterium AA13]
MNAIHRVISVVLVFVVILISAPSYKAQQPSEQQAANQQNSDQQKKDKTTPEEKALIMLDQIIADAGALKLSENRIFIQMSAGDLLWDHDEGRARNLFAQASAGVGELLQKSDSTDARGFGPVRTAVQLRQELLLTVAKHDPALAYQFLQQMPTPPSNGPRRPDQEGALEQNLVALIAAKDPAMALNNVQNWLDKNQYPSAIAKVLGQLQVKDQDSAAKLSSQLLKRLQSDELISKTDAARLSLTLLRPGPRPDKKASDSSQSSQSAEGAQTAAADQFLSESSFRSLLDSVITAALRATPDPNANTGRGGPGGFRGRPNNFNGAAPNNGISTDAQNEQANARTLLSGLQQMMPQVNQYLPERALLVNQKLNELGMNNNQRASFQQMGALLQRGTSDSMAAAAGLAPERMQANIYRQAALKALDEGNTDRARQIASEHLDPSVRGGILQAADLKQSAASAGPKQIEDVRRTLLRAQTDEERTALLLQFVNVIRTDNPKLAVQLLDEARNFLGRRANNLAQFQAQLSIVAAYSALDPQRSFELLEPAINQVNELLGAAALLNGFEVNLFKDGELPVQNGGTLMRMVGSCGERLAALAEKDFERAQMTADRFLLSEPRIIVKLAIVTELLGEDLIEPMDNGRGFGGGRRRGQ